LPPSSSCSARPRTDDELVRVMSKAVIGLGLEWSPPQEPSRNRLDERFGRGASRPLAIARPPSFPKSTMR
jgi:hypothetical protein